MRSSANSLRRLAQGFPGAFGLKDDCALVTPEPGTELVLKTDPIAEGVHFLAEDAPQDVAWKALAVNISDLVAKGATPLGYLMALSFPAAPARNWLSSFADGLREAQERFGCHLLGGDTDRRPGPVTITITAIGSVEHGRMVRRGTARPGDRIFVSGTIGDAALGLTLRRDRRLAGSWGLTDKEAEHLLRRYLRPEPRLALAAPLRSYASAAMDISDGLAKDLMRMCASSGCAARVFLANIPLSNGAANAVAADAALVQQVVAGGDDYEVLAAVPPSRAEGFRSAATQAGVAVAMIGAMERGSGAVFENPEGEPMQISRAGWDHF